MRRSLIVIIIAVLGLLIGCNKQEEISDYLVGKTIDSNIPKIYVVHHISEKEARTKSLSDFLTNEDKSDVMIYHVKDIQLYNDLAIGERVIVKTSGYIMQSQPPQAVAEEIVRWSEGVYF